MATPDELRAAIAAGRVVFRSALESAGTKWEKKPTTVPEGEEPWTPREVVEHVAYAEIRIAAGICVMAGYPGKEAEKPSYPALADAIKGVDEAAAWSDGRLKYVTAEDLVKGNDRGMTVQGMMEILAKHFHDHAAQIRAV